MSVSHRNPPFVFPLRGSFACGLAAASCLASQPGRHFVFAAACQGQQKARRAHNNGCPWHRGGHRCLFCVFCSCLRSASAASGAFSAAAPPAAEHASARSSLLAPRPSPLAPCSSLLAPRSSPLLGVFFFQECGVLAARGGALFGINGRASVPFAILCNSAARLVSWRSELWPGQNGIPQAGWQRRTGMRLSLFPCIPTSPVSTQCSHIALACGSAPPFCFLLRARGAATSAAMAAAGWHQPLFVCLAARL